MLHYYTDFDITIRGTDAPYAVTATYKERSAEGFFRHDITQPNWQQIVQQLGNVSQIPGNARITEAGSTLFSEAIQGSVRDLWVNARTELESQKIDGLRIRLALQPPAVASLPWESLYEPNRNEAFAADGVTTLVRVENLYQYVGPTRPLYSELPLKILIAIPEDPSGQINGAQEIQQITEALADNIPDQIQIATLTGRFDINELRKAIEREQADILHLVSHGRPDAILLWKRGQPDYTPANSLKVTFKRTTSLKLIFLNACLAGKSSEQVPFSTVAPQLLQAGIPAVIAMQFEIRDDAAIEFAQFVYEELVSGPYPGSIDAAVGYARSNLYALDPDQFDYGTPILWLNARNGLIADFPEKLLDSTEQKAKLTERLSEAISVSPSQGLASESTKEISRWLSTVPEIDESQLPAEIRMFSLDWKNAVQELKGLLQQLQHLETANVQDVMVQRTEKLKQIRHKQTLIANLQPLMQKATQPKQ